MIKIAVYGTLRKGFGNYNYYLSDQEFLGEEVVNIPFRMVSLGGFPGLIPTEEYHDAVIEVFNVDEEAFRGIEGLEGYPSFYDRRQIVTSHGEAGIYFLSDRHHYDGRESIPNGDWTEYKNHQRTIRNEILS